MSWTDIEERVAPKSKFDASVRLYQRGASSLPALIIALRSAIMAQLKWKPKDTFGLQLGEGDNAGKVRIVRRATKAIALARQMKTGAMAFDFGHVKQLGERGSLKMDAAARVIDPDTVEVTIPEFEFDDEEQAEEEPAEREEEQTTPPRPTPPPAPTSKPVAARPSTTPAPAKPIPNVTIAGIAIRFDHNDEDITFRGKTMEVTKTQAQVIATLAKAMPQPVGRDFVMSKVFAGRSHDPAASIALDSIVMDLTKALPGVGLQLKNIKGVGLALKDDSLSSRPHLCRT